MQHNITGSQITGALIFTTIGFLFQFGLEYKRHGKIPSIINLFILAIFSYGCGALMFVGLLDSELSPSKKLIAITATSLLGSAIVTGFGSIKAEFFTILGQDILKGLARKILHNSKPKTSEDENKTESAHTEEDEYESDQPQ